MAAQLNTSRLSSILSRTEDIKIPVRVLTAACAIAVVLSLASLLVGAWDARRDREDALRRHVDAQALLALPPVDLDALQAERDEAAAALADVEAALLPPSIDPASDAATALLVRSSEESDLRVTGVNRVPASQLKDGPLTYDVEGIRITVQGTPGQVSSFLSRMEREEPGFIPSLGGFTVDNKDLATAELVFNVYTEVVQPTPVAVAP